MKRAETDLIKSVEAAAGPDRELSRDIWQALDTPEWKTAYLLAQEPCGCPHAQAVEYAGRYLPDLTGSIDAVVDLVERVLPGAEWSVRANVPTHDWCTGTVRVAPLRSIAGECATPPLALLSALLRALQEQANDD